MPNMAEWRILVVEDEPDGQEVVAGLLEYFQIPTDQALSAEDALRLMAENTYAGAVIDLALPGMDGWDLLRLIRNAPATARMPCVAVTAFHTSTVRQQALASGFSAYFPKPLDTDAFLRDFTAIIAKAS